MSSEGYGIRVGDTFYASNLTAGYPSKHLFSGVYIVVELDMVRWRILIEDNEGERNFVNFSREIALLAAQWEKAGVIVNKLED